MDEVEYTNLDSNTDSATKRTPAYGTFAANTNRLMGVLGFVGRGTQHFVDELTNSIAPEVNALCTELAGDDAALNTEQSPEASAASNRREIRERIQTVFLAPTHDFVEGFITIFQWLPVILVTTVEAYLKEVRIFEAQVNPAVIQSSEQKVTYAEVAQAQSVNDLTNEMQGKWARNFVDDGGPTNWIKKLTNMGARGYEPQTAQKMETLWGVRHVIVHSAGVVTADFVRRHRDYGAQAGANIRIRSEHVREWIEVVDHFVDVTDSYFAQRYATALQTRQTNDVRT